MSCAGHSGRGRGPTRKIPLGCCKRIFAKLSEYLDNELDGQARRAIGDHLQQCSPCQVCLTTLRRTVALLRSVEAVPLPDGFSQRLQKRFMRTKS